MRGYFVFSMAYMAGAVLLVELVRGDGLASAVAAVKGTASIIPSADRLLLAAATVALGVLFMARIWGLGRILGRLAYAVVGMIAFLSAFSLVKTLLPEIVPFYADPAFAALDKWLHGGVDPWRLTHAWAEYLPMWLLEPFYMQVWGAGSLLLPIVLATLDSDEARVRRFLVLYVVAWAGLGNIGALAGMSAGPVYYDRLLGTERFVELNAALGTAFTSPIIPTIQENLWMLYSEGYQVVGSGISAFPSVHVAMAGVLGLYLAERLPVLSPVAALFVTVILYLSVFSGYHYAIDGYASILVVVAAWYALRRRQAGRAPEGAAGTAAAPVPAAAG